jgi:hypothetical protein
MVLLPESTSQVRPSNMLRIFISGNYNLRRWGGPQLYYVQATFHENPSTGSKVEIGEYTHREHDDLINLLFSLAKESRLKT